jgi:hypothetical protein
MAFALTVGYPCANVSVTAICRPRGSRTQHTHAGENKPWTPVCGLAGHRHGFRDLRARQSTHAVQNLAVNRACLAAVRLAVSTSTTRVSRR